MTADPRAALLACAADPRADIAEGALWISADDCPGVDRAACMTLLDELGDELRARRGPSGGGALAPTVAAVLRDRLNLRGAGGGDPRAHYLHSVLDRGAGTRLALGAVWIAVGRRAGIDVEGVALPGHFVVRVDGSLVDPIAGGEPLGEEEALRMVGEVVGGEPERLEPRWLEAATTRSLLARMSRSLRGCYASLEQWPMALRAADRCVELLPDQPRERRDRGLLHWRAGRNREALDDLRDYLDRCPEAADGEKIREIAGRLRASLN